ncbi:MAG: MoaD/ThiS family protein [Chloroflexaceae bacterium]|nr:MoaD/ThiS family protein [Chloroflexaceae bacterium]
MAITITIPTALRQYTENQASVEFESETVSGVLRSLVERFPAVGKHLYTEQGKLRSFVNIYVGDEDIRYLEGEQTPVRSGDIVSIIPAIAGGSGR